MPSNSDLSKGSNRGWKSRLLLRLAKWVLAPVLSVAILMAGFWLIFPATAKSAATTVAGQLLLRYLAFRSGTGLFEGGFVAQVDISVPMRDRIHLATDLYLPTAQGPHPTILIRTPYTKGEAKAVGEFFARYGYAVVVQDTRGRHKSEGEFYPFRNEHADGVDLTRWVKQQAWCNGKLGGFGGSYLGFTQWAMADGNSDLSSISPAFITSDLYSGIYQRGAFGQLSFLHWSLTSYGRFGNMNGAANIKKGFGHFPLIEADDAAGRNVGFYDEWVTHPTPDSYWLEMSPRQRPQSVTTPAFLVAGWYDFFRDAQIHDFQSIRQDGAPNARTATKILIGPWGHGFFSINLKNYGVQPGSLEVIPFEYVRESKAWLDYSLKGTANGWDRRAPVRVFVLGENEWRDEQEWPPARASYRPYHLHSKGHASTLHGDGTLTEAQPTGAEPADSFVFDPLNPVPTKGGSHGDIWFSGPADQTEIEKRPDVLVYSSEPLQQSLLIMGPVRVKLFASSTATDTDFTAKLVDVFADGRALILCEGIVRARYRNGLDRPEFMQPGNVYPLDIEVGHTAVHLQAGHRIRLEVSSSNSPRYDVNPNTGGPVATERAPVRATQRILHSADAVSTLILPVIDR